MIKYRYTYLLLGLSPILAWGMLLASPSEAHTDGVQNKIDFNAIITGDKIVFSLKNTSSGFILIDDDFCSLTAMNTYFLRPNGKIDRSPYFQQGFIHPSVRLLKLKPEQEISCSIESTQEMRDYSGNGLIIWQTKFFLATDNNRYQTLLRNGTFQVGDGIGVEVSSDIDVSAYKKRALLGVRDR